MPEQCGCKANRKRTRAEQAGLDRWEEPDDLIFCPLHAHAAEMRELLRRWTGIWGPEALKSNQTLAEDTRALLEATHA